MALYIPPYYSDWEPERLKEEIKKLRKQRQIILRDHQRTNSQLVGLRVTISGMQSSLVNKLNLRDYLDGWGRDI